ncbi:hypothetical protein Cob_v006364 [Colletotrichum orbiculare MAFF 240422]|uniref:Uncharacterized protein n=1 Tax=Colletotrichum orbiculare (strain 104-T / ATCC 96160 / CBS 514.97 / LARS 414 / MAFF 240422) TaxID=1213857 RepID=A0A484FQ56_COLOR|nr:hypothetical protein Cob_v006364 [Colletotrichum orbiculare MAFF 240422]
MTLRHLAQLWREDHAKLRQELLSLVLLGCRLAALHHLVQILNESPASVQCLRRGRLLVLAQFALTGEAPLLQAFLGRLVVVSRSGLLVPEQQLGAGIEVLGGSHNHHVADERATTISDAGMVEMGRNDPNTASRI